MYVKFARRCQRQIPCQEHTPSRSGEASKSLEVALIVGLMSREKCSSKYGRSKQNRRKLCNSTFIVRHTLLRRVFENEALIEALDI